MRLISLTSDRPSFRPLHFNPTGLTVIVGDAGDEEGSSNGTGKTLALNLVHHCLAATKDKLLEKAVPDWLFRLEFLLPDGTHLIERSGDSGSLALDEQAISLRGLQEWLNVNGPFDLEGVPGGNVSRVLSSFRTPTTRGSK